MSGSRYLRGFVDRVAGAVLRLGAPPSAGQELVLLRGRHRLVVDRGQDRDSVTLVAGDGAVRLRIAVGDQGNEAEISIEAARVSLRTSGSLEIDAARLRLHGRQGVALTTDAGARIEADESVHVNGARIYLNS